MRLENGVDGRAARLRSAGEKMQSAAAVLKRFTANTTACASASVSLLSAIPCGLHQNRSCFEKTPL
jgi:hypothetical protein